MKTMHIIRGDFEQRPRDNETVARRRREDREYAAMLEDLDRKMERLDEVNARVAVTLRGNRESLRNTLTKEE